MHGVEHHVVSDRIEAGTFLCAVACTGGEVFLKGANAHHLEAVIEKLVSAGVSIKEVAGGIWVSAPKDPYLHLKAQSFRTTEYPGFPTDMQAQFVALNCIANGTGVVHEDIFENRFMHVQELARLGAHIHLDGETATIEGVERLKGAPVMATDLRASVSLVLAGLVADGETELNRVYHLDRGYERLEAKLAACGAEIERIKAP